MPVETNANWIVKLLLDFLIIPRLMLSKHNCYARNSVHNREKIIYLHCKSHARLARALPTLLD